MKPKRVYTYLIVFMIVNFLSISGLGCECVTPTSSPSTTIIATRFSPTPAASPTCTVWSPPTWRSITPGKTSKQETLQILGEPNMSKVWGNLESLHYFPDDSFVHTFYRVVIQDGIAVMLLVEDTNGEQVETLNECIRCYNEPESEDEQREGPITATIQLYPRCGIAFVKVAAQTIGTLYFVPTTLEEYRNTWGRYYPEDDPISRLFPGLPDTAGVVPGQTTSMTFERSLTIA